MVACTQPRRIAATSVAKRVAEEMDRESRYLPHCIGHDKGGMISLTQCF